MSDLTPPLHVPANCSAPAEVDGQGEFLVDGGATDTPIRRAARAYVARGLRLVRLRPGTKQPYSKAWQNAEPKPDEFGPQDNIGVQLGAKSRHLVDIDFDIPEARTLSGLPCFFGHLPSFRRESLRVEAPGHRLVVCHDAPEAVEKFDFRGAKENAAIKPLRLPKAVALELRAGRGFTVFPPSRLGDDRLVYGTRFDQLPEMSWSELRSRAGLLAFAAVAAACYPPEGNRDNFCFHLAGAVPLFANSDQTDGEFSIEVNNTNIAARTEQIEAGLTKLESASTVGTTSLSTSCSSRATRSWTECGDRRTSCDSAAPLPTG